MLGRRSDTWDVLMMTGKLSIVYYSCLEMSPCLTVEMLVNSFLSSSHQDISENNILLREWQIILKNTNKVVIKLFIFRGTKLPSWEAEKNWSETSTIRVSWSGMSHTVLSKIWQGGVESGEWGRILLELCTFKPSLIVFPWPKAKMFPINFTTAICWLC